MLLHPQGAFLSTLFSSNCCKTDHPKQEALKGVLSTSTWTLQAVLWWSFIVQIKPIISQEGVHIKYVSWQQCTLPGLSCGCETWSLEGLQVTDKNVLKIINLLCLLSCRKQAVLLAVNNCAPHTVLCIAQCYAVMMRGDDKRWGETVHITGASKSNRALGPTYIECVLLCSHQYHGHNALLRLPVQTYVHFTH